MTASPRDDDPQAAWDEGALVSRRFGDVYASRSGALAQSRQVFLAGCGLPGRWAGRRRFTVAELGFGTGLNMLALLEAWARTRPPGATLHLFSVEAYPLAHADAARALAAFPELAALAAPLLAAWPRGARGLHRIAWPALGATLDLAILDAADALAGWSGSADAWFLDGFAPAVNPAMWSADLLAQVGRCTAPGGRAATWSVAAAVREGLSAAGFAVERRPGFAGKRQRLEARMSGEAVDPPIPRVAVIGSGIAGASLARALHELGLEPRVFAAGPMASGNPAALVSPRLVAGSEAAAALHAQAFRRAVACIEATAPAAVLARGLRRHLLGRAEPERGEATLRSRLFDPASLALDADGALQVADALVVAPSRLRKAWLPAVEPLPVVGLLRDAEGWWLLGEAGRQGPFDSVCLAAGPALAALAGLPLRPVRGQIAHAALPLEGPPESWGGYLIPTDDGLLFGATHDRDDAGWDVRPADTARNLAQLARVHPDLAARLAAEPLGASAGVRAAAPDHQPVAGALGDGLFVLGGLGGRGFTLAPLLAEHVAAEVARVPSPLMVPQARLIDPRRFRSSPGSSTGAPDGPSAAAPDAGAGGSAG